MLRHLVRNFQRVLTLHTTTTTNRGHVLQSLAAATRIVQRTFVQMEPPVPPAATDASAAGTQTEDSEDFLELANIEADTEYIVPYRVEQEHIMSQKALLEALRTRFRLTAADEKRLLSDETLQRSTKRGSLVQTLDALCLVGVNKRSFIEQPWMLTQEKKRVDLKIALIRSMPVRDFNHFVPFMRLTLPRLRRLTSSLNREAEFVPTGNRVYYISQKLHMDAYVVSKYLSKRLFILEMPFDMLETNLRHMLHYNVSPLNIIKDLWAFRYTPKSVQLRLERAKTAKKDKIMPWMVRCPEPILQRSLKLSLDELAVLGDKTSSVEYVAERLQFSVDEANAIMAKHPQVYRVRVTKIKEVLDYLLDEVHFTRYEIAQVPRILCHSLETTKARLEELQKLGCRPTSLIIVCRSKREYDKFLSSWMDMLKKGYVPKNAVNVDEAIKENEIKAAA